VHLPVRPPAGASPIVLLVLRPMFQHQVDFVADGGPEVPGRDRGIRPTGLLEDLTDREGFDEVAVIRERSRVPLRDLLEGKVQQPCHHAGINHVHLGMTGDAGAQGRAPGGQALDEEDRFEQLDVVLGGGFLQSGDAADGGETSLSMTRLT